MGCFPTLNCSLYKNCFQTEHKIVPHEIKNARRKAPLVNGTYLQTDMADTRENQYFRELRKPASDDLKMELDSSGFDQLKSIFSGQSKCIFSGQ